MLSTVYQHHHAVALGMVKAPSHQADQASMDPTTNNAPAPADRHCACPFDLSSWGRFGTACGFVANRYMSQKLCSLQALRPLEACRLAIGIHLYRLEANGSATQHADRCAYGDRVVMLELPE